MAVTCTPAVCQHAAIHALSGFADAERAAIVQALRARRDFALGCLAEHTFLSCVRPAGTFYMFVDISPVMAVFGSSEALAMRLLEKEKVITVPGSAFGRLGEGHLRLSFAPDPPVLEEGIRRLGRFLAGTSASRSG